MTVRVTAPARTTRPSLNAAIEELRLAVKNRTEAQNTTTTTFPANLRPTKLERDDDENIGPKTCSWSPEMIDGRLHQLTNGRWLRPWKRSGESELRPPLIDEVDQTGVDRHQIAIIISPELLAQIEEDVRMERASLCATQTTNPKVTIWSFQHLLLQRLQGIILSGGQLPSQLLPTHQWQVGDAVLYCGEAYTIARVTDTQIALASETAGEFDLITSGSEIRRLRRVSSTTY